MIAVCVREPRCLADYRSIGQSLIARPGFLCSAIGRRYACHSARIYGKFYFVCISRSCRKHSITITLTSNPSGRPFHPTLSVKTSDTLAGLCLCRHTLMPMHGIPARYVVTFLLVFLANALRSCLFASSNNRAESANCVAGICESPW